MKTFQQARIRVMKVDVEGYEAGVFASMAQILSKKAVDNILFEIVPYINGLERNEAIFAQLLEAGYVTSFLLSLSPSLSLSFFLSFFLFIIA